MFRKLLTTGIILLAMGLSGTGIMAWVYLFSPMDISSESHYFEVKPGPFAKVAEQLQLQGFIRSATAFNLYARLQSAATKIRVGEFELRKSMTAVEILETLLSGEMVQHSFTVQEGLNIYEIAELLSEQGLADREDFLRLAKNPSFIQALLKKNVPSLEGYLFPDTYRVTRYEGAKKILQTMVERFKLVYQEIEKTELDLDPHQVVILASMIEKETGAPEERPLISSVFHNRLRKRMRLQSDPTILYGIRETHGVWKKNIQKKDILERTAYNTYKIPGLPAGPIANPGRESLQAVFRPAESEYLYFVSRNDGTHKFSKTYEEHRRAVVDFQLNPEARRGKSWRDRNR